MQAENALRFLSLGAIAALPFAGPTDMVWAQVALAVWFMGLALAAQCLTQSNQVSDWRRPLFWVLAVCIGIACLQLWPLPVALLKILSPISAQWQQGQTLAPISLDPAATQLVMVKLMGAVALVWLLQSQLFRGQHKYKVLEVLAYTAAVQAVIGCVAVLGGAQWGPYFEEKQFGRAYATGTFVYHNHLAAYLNLGLLACIVLITRRDAGEESLQVKRLRASVFRLLAVVIVIGLTMTHSRGGALSFSVMIAAYLGISLFKAVRAPKHSPKLWLGPLLLALSVILVDVLVVSNWFGLEKLAKRVESTSLVVETRDDVAAELIDDLYPARLGPFGIGLGAFEASFPVMKSKVIKNHYHYAHNDWLELGLSVGWAGGLVILCGVIAVMLGVGASPFGAVPLILLALLVGTHAAVDFAYGSYASFMTAVALLAALTRHSRSNRVLLPPQPHPAIGNS